MDTFFFSPLAKCIRLNTKKKNVHTEESAKIIGHKLKLKQLRLHLGDRITAPIKHADQCARLRLPTFYIL